MLTLTLVAGCVLLMASCVGADALTAQERAIALTPDEGPNASAGARGTRAARRFPAV